MAGTFTHFAICNRAKSQNSVIGQELYNLLKGNYPLMFLGSVSPDLPYLSFRQGKTNWADVMHHERTNSVVVIGCEELRQKWQNRQAEDVAKLAWLLGYAAHLVVDATVHPVIKKIFGKYEANKEEHKACEMTQDSIIFKEWMGKEIKDSEFSEILRYSMQTPEIEVVTGFWTQLLTKAYPQKGEAPNTKIWVRTYAKAFDFEEGDSGTTSIFGRPGKIEKLVFKSSTEIIRAQPEEYAKYYTNVLLPAGGEGNFEKDVAEKAVQNVTNAWKDIMVSITTGTLIAEHIKNWNLDTGEDQDTPDHEITYWV